MANLKTSIKPFVLLVAAFEVQLEVLDGHPQTKKSKVFFLVQAVELRFEFRSELRMVKLKTVKTSCFRGWDG